MKTRIVASLAATALLLPTLAFAQSAAVTTSVNANVNAAGVTAGASATVSASAVATAKTRADTEISRRTAALEALNTRVGQMTRVTDAFKSQLSSSLTAQISALATLKATIDADADTTTLKTDIKSITTSYRIYALILPQGRIAAAADRAVNIATMESALGAKLEARINAAPAGTDTSALTAALADLSAKATDAVTQAQASVTLTAALQPDNGDATVMASNTASLKTGRDDITAAQKDLVAARADITTIVNGLPKVSASASTSASAQ
jgi:hypothetical protein